MAFISGIMVKHSILNNVIGFQHIQQKDDNCVLLINFIVFYSASQLSTKEASTLPSINQLYLSSSTTLL
jgi:hypothetical protein